MKINDVIEERRKLGVRLTETNAILKEYTTQKLDLDYKLLTLMEEQGLKRTANEVCSVSINEDTVPEVYDYDLFNAHVVKEEATELYQNRVSSPACKERWKLGEDIPGVRPREIKRVNVRNL